jgi:glycosyltransferase involved in cell wall biosynthesis
MDDTSPSNVDSDNRLTDRSTRTEVPILTAGSTEARTQPGRDGHDRLTILYFGNDWTAENRTSSHHIARWLAKRHRVYYLECPGLRAPKSSGRDVKKIGAKFFRFLRGPRTSPEGLKVWTLLQLPLHRFRVVRWLNRWLILGAVGWLMLTERVRGPVAWFTVPHLASVVGRLGQRLSVYYCIDDYSALPDVNEGAVRAMDEELTRRADLVFIASDTLLEGKRRLNPATQVSPHGVDLEHFARAYDGRARVPADMRDLPRPVVGFFGLIEKWIDLDLVAYLADRRPAWTFVLVGRVAAPPEEVPVRPNVQFLGPRPYDQLPDYGAQFDAAIIPYRLTRQVLHANPIKLREYLAMGKPVVSVSTPEIDKYADVVRIAHTKEAFLEYLDAVVTAEPSPAEVVRRVARVAGEGWDARLEQVMQVVRARLAVQAESPRGKIRGPDGRKFEPESGPPVGSHGPMA